VHSQLQCSGLGANLSWSQPARAWASHPSACSV
jgi:hypothetical protein